MRKFFAPLFLLLLASFFVKPIFAGNDITITCNNGSNCTKSSELPLFLETNIYPGFAHSQIFSVDNNRNTPCNLKFKAVSTSPVSDILSEKILINILGTNSNNNYSLVDYPLNDLLDPTKPTVSLGRVNTGVKNNYLWSVVFDKNAGNEYQNQISKFDINFNFECDEESTDDPSNTSNNPPSTLGATNCTNSIPNAPTGLSATRNPSGSVTLHWTHSTSTHTGYLIAYGPNPNNYIYGNPNIGNNDYYTVGNLTYGAQYCFYVRSLNGCMPGNRTPEYCVNSGSSVVSSNVVPTGFEPGVLGESTENNSKVLGSENNCKSYWLPLLFIVAFLINLIYIRHSKKYKLIPFLISLLAFLIDKYLLKSNCCLGPNWLCNYFWIGNILSWLIPLLTKK